MTTFNEHIVYQCKLHRGIFLMPVFSLLACLIPTLFYLWMINSFFSAMRADGFDVHFPWMILLLPGLVIGGMSFIVVLIEYLKSEVVLTDQHLKFKVGWLTLSSTEILLSKIETISLQEPLVGRLAGYGTVSVTGTGGAVFRLRFLPDPQHFHSLLQLMVNQAHTIRPPGYAALTPPTIHSPAYDESRYMPKG